MSQKKSYKKAPQGKMEADDEELLLALASKYKHDWKKVSKKIFKLHIKRPPKARWRQMTKNFYWHLLPSTNMTGRKSQRKSLNSIKRNWVQINSESVTRNSHQI
jgi:hypothetical protein